MISPAILTTESQGSLNLTPDCIISSVALRAKSTAEQVAEVCK